MVHFRSILVSHPNRKQETIESQNEINRTVEPSTQCRFLLLPGELRNRIYTYLAPSLSTNVIAIKLPPSALTRMLRRFMPRGYASDPRIAEALDKALEYILPLLAVDKQIRRELLSMVSINRAMMFHTPWQGEHSDTVDVIERAGKWLHQFGGPGEGIEAIKHFRILVASDLWQPATWGLDICRVSDGDHGAAAYRVAVMVGQEDVVHPPTFLFDKSWVRLPSLTGDSAKCLRQYAARAVVYLAEVQAEGRDDGLERDDILNLMRLARGRKYWRGEGLAGYHSITTTLSRTLKVLTGKEEHIENARRRVHSATLFPARVEGDGGRQVGVE